MGKPGIPSYKLKFGWKARYFHSKNTEDEGVAQVKRNQRADGTNMAAGIHTQLQHRVTPVATTSQLVTTDCAGCCLGCCLGCTKLAVVVNTEGNTPAVWGAVRVPAVERRDHTQKHNPNINHPRVSLHFLTNGAAEL